MFFGSLSTKHISACLQDFTIFTFLIFEKSILLNSEELTYTFTSLFLISEPPPLNAYAL